MVLTEAEDIKKRWQEYIEQYKKDLHVQDNHDDMITYLEPDILECEVKWALGSNITNKASGGDGTPGELGCYCQVTSVVSDSVRPQRRQPTRLPIPGILQARVLEWGAKIHTSCIAENWLEEF